MNVLIITEEDVFYVYEFFKKYFPAAKNAEYNISAITILAPFNKRSKIALAKQMYGFYGPLNFLLMGFLYMFKKYSGRTIEGLSRKYGIKLMLAHNVNNQEYVNEIKLKKIDIIVSIAAPQIFKSNILNSVKYGCINSHSSLLPENRGMMPVFWGMYKREENIGVTIHYMNEKLDKGDIIKQEKVPVDSRSLNEMIMKTKRISARLVHEALNEIRNGKSRSVSMPKGGSYQTFPTPDEVKEFRRRGFTII